MKPLLRQVFLLLTAMLATPACTAPRHGAAPPAEPAATRLPVAPDPHWGVIFDRGEGWLAADGASTLDIGGGRVLWLFGDTLIGELKPDGGCAEGTKMVNNTIGVQTIGAPLGDAVSFHAARPRLGAGPESWASSPAALGPRAGDHWLWPAGGGIRFGEGDAERVVLFFMMMRRKSQGDAEGIWNFQQHGSATVTVLSPADPPERWRIEIAPLRDLEPAIDAGSPVRLINWGSVVIADPDDAARVLIYGVDVSENLNKRLVLARAPIESITRFETWEFKTGEGWSGSESAAAPLGGAMADEFSVHRRRIDGGERYVLTQMEGNLGRRIMVRFADRPDGPWTEPVAIYACPEPAQDTRSFVYSAKAHPELEPGRRDGSLLVTYCVNSTDFWYMLAHAGMYRPRFVRVPGAALEAAWESARGG